VAAEHKPDFHVVGIGASAGGLDALRAFFSRMPASPGFACVVVVHLSPEHESHLVQLLQPYAQMPVCQVVETTVLEPNRVYVIPPNANLNSIDTHLRLSELEQRRAHRAPIDHFLRTLAQTHGETAIGVILSGTGSDGALGIRQIKERGGLTIAQDPQEAEYGSMPQAALATGTVDLVLSVRDMAEEIIAYCTARPDVTLPAEGEGLSEAEASLLEKILGEVRLRTGQEFAMFRTSMVLQRVRRRMRVRHVSSLAEYFEVLRTRAGEPRALYDDLLLNVTEFFRDPETYHTIEMVLHEILNRKDDSFTRVRVWSIGCSTGEEAYSLAMLLVEESASHEGEPVLQIFASESSPNALQQARDGVYPQEIAASISPERLQRFFLLENGRYRVRRELRDLVTFATHDLFKDPPYSRLDLIVCRSLLRDLQPQMRRGVLSLFYYALEPHGVLLIGQGDELDTLGLFVRDSGNAQLLRRVSGPRRNLELPPGVRPFARLSGERGGAPVFLDKHDTAAMFRASIERYTPPSVLIDGDNRVVHFSATAARYMRIPGGELTLDIIGMVPDVVGYRLRKGLQLVRRGLDSWRSEPFAIAIDGRARRMIVRIDRTNPAGIAPETLLVVFDDGVLPEAPEDGVERHLDQMLRLEAELQSAHHQVATLSEMAPRGRTGSDETQRQRNEELVTVVEELGSAREELQAVNEELVSLNDENQYRIETLAQLSNDLQHLLESTGLATVLVDRLLNIVRFTPLASDLLRLREEDIGRPLGDLHHSLHHPSLTKDMQRVLTEMTPRELECESDDHRWFLARIQPYHTALRGLEGVVLVLIDITARKRAELALRESDRRKDEFLAVLAHELRNPLAPITAGIELLGKIPEDSTLVRQITATMARQTRQLVRLVDDLLEVGRISEGKLNLRTQPVVISDVVRDAVAAVRPFADSLQHELTVELNPVPLIVEGDATRLVQVIGNLLNNAARYTPPGGRIAVRVRQANDDAVIAVEDNGIGIAPQSLGKVFDMFYQGGESGGVNSSGLGIGLTLAKKLVEMHSGTLTAESAGTNKGSTFIVRLPLARSAAESAVEEASDSVANAQQRHRVLIVDDNEDAAESLCRLMKVLDGGDVRTAFSGAQALEVGAKLRPDVVLLDLAMPGMDGYEVARRMRAESWGREAVLVALTGWGQEHHRRRSQEAGFDRHMTKPADPEALRAVLSGN
jgi:two-component system CheB/CheR fusion protein